MDEHTHFDFAALTDRERYKLLIGTVIPCPVALITTVGLDGVPNAGPFSFLNVLTHDPAIIAVGVENYADMRFKDTARNIRETGEFTIHIVDTARRGLDNGGAYGSPLADASTSLGSATRPCKLQRLLS